jgi:hypothetical protein
MTRRMAKLGLLAVLTLIGCGSSSVPADAAVVGDQHVDWPPIDAGKAPCPTTTWKQIAVPSAADLRGVWGTGAEDVFLVGAGGVVMRRAQGSWARVPQQLYDGPLYAVWTAGAQRAVWVSGERGLLLRYDRSSSSFARVDLRGTDSPAGTINALGGLGHQLFAGGSLSVLENYVPEWAVFRVDTAAQPVTFTAEEHQMFHGARIFDLSAAGGEVFAAAGRLLLRRDASGAWKPKFYDSAPQGKADRFYQGVFALAADDVYVVGRDEDLDASLARWDGKQWTESKLPATQTPTAVWGAASNDIYTVGVAGEVLHFDGATWKPMCTPTNNTLRAVWGTSDGKHVYAVGDRGTVLRLAR